MTSIDISRQMEAENLARGRAMVQMILRNWDWLTWSALLADNVVLSIRLGAEGVRRFGGIGAAGNLQVTGSEEAIRVLKSIYGDLRSGLSVTTEIVSGYDVALLGNWAMASKKEDTETLLLPIAIYMAFGDDGRIEKMTIAAVDVNPLTEAIRASLRSGADQAP